MSSSKNKKTLDKEAVLINEVNIGIKKLTSGMPPLIMTRGQYMKRNGKVLAQIQNAIVDVLRLRNEDTTSYTANKYKSYSSAILELSKKYTGQADWGVAQTGAIIDLRSAFQIGDGIQISIKPGLEKEIGGKLEKEILDFVNEMIELNDIDREMAQDWAKEGEIEGCSLHKLIWDEEVLNVNARFISRSSSPYTIHVVEGDYSKYSKVTGKTAKGVEFTLLPDEFVYKRFGGRVNQPNAPYPKVAKCLTQIENLDKAIRDWRKMDKLFASPTPHIECENTQQAKAMNEELKNKNFKIGKAFAHTGKMSYLEISGAGQESIKEEIITNSKIISGTTSVPVHFLGMPDLMSNRATAESLFEMISAGTQKERKTWIGLYEEMFNKAIAMRNKNLAKGKFRAYPENCIKVDIPLMTEQEWKHIIEVYMPMNVAGKLSDEALWRMTPGVDLEEETRLKVERAKAFENSVLNNRSSIQDGENNNKEGGKIEE